jgi:hypothetical protein
VRVNCSGIKTRLQIEENEGYSPPEQLRRAGDGKEKGLGPDFRRDDE